MNLLRMISLFLFLWQTSALADQDLLTKTFVSKINHYSIHYPATLTYYDRGKGVVVFKSTVKNPSSSIMINIQTILTKKGGGTYASVKDLMDDFQSQVPRHTESANFFDRKPITLIGNDGNKLFGEEITLIFKENHQTFKQWQIMMMNKDGNIFQAWAYRAPLQNFAINLPLAKAMLASWSID